MNEFIKEMLQLGAELEKTESPMQASMIINDAEILYRDEIKALTIPVVTQQRELLKTFCQYIGADTLVNKDDMLTDINEHIRVFNCG